MQAFQNQFTDFYKKMDTSNYMKMWQDGMKLMEGSCPMKMPAGCDNTAKFQEHMNGIISNSMKSMEMMMEAAHKASEAGQEIMKQKFEIMQKRYVEMMNLSKDLAQTNDPETAISKQADFARKSMETMVNDFKDMTDTVSAASMEVFTKAGEKVHKGMYMHKGKECGTKPAK